MEGSKKYWVGFNLVKGIGAARLRTILNYFGDIEYAWKAPASEYKNIGISYKIINALQGIRSGDTLEQTWQLIQEKDISILTWDDPEYPRRLLEIDQPPPVLYIRGKLLSDDHWAVAIVGTRRITAYGRQATKDLAGELARNGITVVSGLARGVDGEAHRATLRYQGRTIAVLGSGVDIIYPPEHRKLAEEIIDHGAIISDYPPGTAPEGTNFPPRNRIISGLSQAVVIVEAGVKSGALITASFAAEQGREVFAVPGSIYAPQSKGTNILVREGAHLLMDSQSILEILNYEQLSEKREARTVLPTDATEAKLFNLLGNEPLHVDEIRAQTNLPIEKISAALTIMELKGMVRQVGHMHFIAICEPQANYKV